MNSYEYDKDVALMRPKLSWKFRVMFQVEGMENTMDLTKQVVSVSRPTMSMNEMEMKGLMTRSITIEFRDDIMSKASSMLMKIFNNQVDSKGEWKFQVDIENVDGENGNAVVLDKWELHGATIREIAYPDSHYSESSSQTITVHVNYDRAEFHAMGEATNHEADQLCV